MRAAAALLGVLLAVPAVAQPQAGEPPAVALEVEDERPVLGQTVRLRASAAGRPLAGARVVATYRPNSSTTSTAELTTDATGTVSWVPDAAGPVNLQLWDPAAAADAAPVVTTAVAVRYGRFPPAGLLIMLLAGALLFGGAAFGMISLLRAPVGPPDSEPPST